MVSECMCENRWTEGCPDAFIHPNCDCSFMSDMDIKISKKDELIIELVRAEYMTNRLKENIREFVQCPEAKYHQDRLLMRPSYAWARKIAVYAYDNCDSKKVFDSSDLLDYGVEDVVGDCVFDELFKAGLFDETEDPNDFEPRSPGSDAVCIDYNGTYLDKMKYSFYANRCSSDRWTELDALDPSTLAKMLTDTISRYEEIVEMMKKAAEL